jgi:hypothetical protein
LTRSSRSSAREGGAAHGQSASSKTSPSPATRLQPFLRSSADTLDWTGRPHLDRVTITGPFNATGWRHAGASKDLRLQAGRFRERNRVCKQIIATLARRATGSRSNRSTCSA